MLTPDSRIDTQSLRASVTEHYGFDPGELGFVPAGEDSWAYASRDYWVSVRRDIRGHDARAYAFAMRLRDHGVLDAVAPLPSIGGCSVMSFGERPVTVSHRVVAAPLDDSRASEDLIAVAELLNRLHADGPRVADDLPIEDYSPRFLEDIRASQEWSARRPVTAGPFSARLRASLADARVPLADAVSSLREHAHAARHDRASLTTTHGDASAQNFVRRATGVALLDWGSAARGHRGRDWFQVERTFGWTPAEHRTHLPYYRLRWTLSEIAEYSVHFRSPHGTTEDDVAMWNRLQHYLGLLPSSTV